MIFPKRKRDASFKVLNELTKQKKFSCGEEIIKAFVGGFKITRQLGRLYASIFCRNPLLETILTVARVSTWKRVLSY